MLAQLGNCLLALGKCVEAEEPLQLGVVKDPSNVSPTKGYLDGSAVRGAVAAALRGEGADTLEEVFGGTTPSCF